MIVVVKTAPLLPFRYLVIDNDECRCFQVERRLTGRLEGPVAGTIPENQGGVAV
jgi:hypothetical protein